MRYFVFFSWPSLILLWFGTVIYEMTTFSTVEADIVLINGLFLVMVSPAGVLEIPLVLPHKFVKFLHDDLASLLNCSANFSFETNGSIDVAASALVILELDHHRVLFPIQTHKL